MAVIIKKINGKSVYNSIKITEEEKDRALKLDEALAKLGAEIEKEWLSKRKKEGTGIKIDVEVAYNIGKKIARVVDNENLVSPNELYWVWKALRERHLRENIIKIRGKTRDDLEYFYKASKYPLKFIKSISWDGWSRLLDYPSIRQDERFERWLQEKAKSIGELKKGFFRKFSKNLYSLIKDKDTTVLSDQELFEIYEFAWDNSS
ncbi:MAG: hypothetical protein ACE5KE_07390 [Methanosarcinales archaeon]